MELKYHEIIVKDLFWVWTVPVFILLLAFVGGCLFFTRNESICCQVLGFLKNHADFILINSRFATETSR